MGDFNIDLLSGLTLSNLILQPTRITDHSETIIDNIFFNSTDYDLTSWNLICLKYNMPLSQWKTNIYARDYSKLNEIAMGDEIKC
jgi:hypothetical protein